MESFGNVQYPQYPSWGGIMNNKNNDDVSRDGNYYHQPFIPIHEDPYTSSGSSGYGDSAPSDYGLDHYSEHTGPSSTGYSGPIHHQPPPSSTKSSTFFGLKKGGSSAMSALTLLSFFFFINLLQSCLKEHMDTANPTVMVMTNLGVRNRNKKIVEINSREQSTSQGSTGTTGEHIVVQPDDVISAAVATSPHATIAATLTVAAQNKPAAENVQILSNNNDNDNGGAHAYPASTTASDRPNIHVFDAEYSYPNRTAALYPDYPSSDRYRPQHYHDDYYFSHHGDPWSNRRHTHYGNGANDPYYDPYENRVFANHDGYDDASYLRIF